MNKVTELENALTELFRKGTEVGYSETEIDEFLEDIDYDTLLQAVWNNAETVYSYRADGEHEFSIEPVHGLFFILSKVQYVVFRQQFVQIMRARSNASHFIHERYFITTVRSVYANRKAYSFLLSLYLANLRPSILRRGSM